MARTDVHSKVVGFCITELEVNGTLYKSLRLNVMTKLCVLLRLDFQTQHKRLVYDFNGDLPEFIVCNNSKNCALVAAVTDDTMLFPNFPTDCKPIATKSRRFNQSDKDVIKLTMEQWVNVGIIEHSASPWRAQVVVVKDENDIHRKRLCVDYSQTVNIYTELDAFPLPRIDENVNNLSQYCYFSTFDLKSAYHQISIPEYDRKYTAFEANGKLWQFMRMAMFKKWWQALSFSIFVKNQLSFIDQVNLFSLTRNFQRTSSVVIGAYLN